MVKGISTSGLEGRLNENVTDFSILEELSPPEWLVQGRLVDDEWTILTDDPTKKRHAKVQIQFKLPIHFGPIWLTDPAAHHDLLTAKLFVYYSLSTIDGWNHAASAVGLMYRYLIHMMRWKWNQGIRRTADLSRSWFNKYQGTVVDHGLEGLLQSEKSVSFVLDYFRENPSETPIECRSGKRMLRRTTIYEMAGLSHWSQLSANARALIDSFCQESGLFIPKRGKDFPVEENHAGTRVYSKDDLHSSHLGGFFSVWQRLWDLGDKLAHDPLSFRPFEHRQDASIAAVQMSNRQRSRTPTAPPHQTCFLIDRSIRWVLLYSKDLRNFVEQLETKASNSPRMLRADIVNHVRQKFEPVYCGRDHPASPWPLGWVNYTATSEQAAVSVQKAVFTFLPVACAVVIAAFSARRKEEIESLRAGCLVLEDGDYNMEVWIEKTLRTLEKIPVPYVVAHAIEVLEWLSAKHRQRVDQKWLFAFDTLIPFTGKHRTVGFKFNGCLHEFVDFIDLPALPDGRKWRFTPRQFRRFFAITYYYRYRDSSLSALTEYLKHFNPETTRQYITDVARGSLARLAEEADSVSTAASMHAVKAQSKLTDFDEVALEFRQEVLSGVSDGSIKLAGFGGEAIYSEFQALVQSTLQNLRVGFDPEEKEQAINKAITAFSKSLVLEPKALGHSFCKCSSSQADLAHALCVKKSGGNTDVIKKPDNRYAADTTCAKCPHNVQLPENEAYWRQLIEDLLKSLNNQTSAFAKLHSQQRLNTAQELYERCFPASLTGQSS